MGTVTIHIRSVIWLATAAMLGAAVAVTFASAWHVDAAPGDSDATFVSITPCRLADTRPATNRVGTAGQLGGQATQSFDVHGDNGECTIPTEAVSVALNVTALNATVRSFLTFWPEGSRPLASSLNPAPGEPPTPNAVTVDLSAAGGFNVFNNAGTVDVIIDVNGYYVQSSLQELTQRLDAVEAAQNAGLDPALLTRLDAIEADTETNASAIATLGVAQPFVVSRAETNQVSLTGSPVSYIDVSVTAPTAGRVSLTGTSIVDNTVDGGDLACTIAESGAVPATLLSGPTGGNGWFESSATANTGQVTAQAVFTITAGGTVDYVFACEEGSGAAGRLFARLLVATFTPDL